MTRMSLSLVKAVWGHLISKRSIPYLALTVVVLATVWVAFLPGPVFVGDFTSAPRLSPLTQASYAFSQTILGVRNGGFPSSSLDFRWSLLPLYLTEEFPSAITGDASYAKLILPLYLAVGALGVLCVYHSILQRRGIERTVTRELFGVGLSLLYVFNPISEQLLIKGYWTDLPILGLLPLVFFLYVKLHGTSSRPVMLSLLFLVGLLAFIMLSSTYAILLVAILILTCELFPFNPSRRVLTTIFPDFFTRPVIFLGIVTLVELPTLYQIFVVSAPGVTFPGGLSLYYSVNSFVSPLTVLTLTTASFGPGYFQTSLPELAMVFEAGMIVLVVLITLGVLRGGRLDIEKRRALALYIAALTISLGPILFVNTYVYDAVPLFLETLELMPLTVFAIVLVSAEIILPYVIRLESLEGDFAAEVVQKSGAAPSSVSGLTRRLRRTESTVVRAAVGVVLVVLVLISTVAFGAASDQNLSPVRLPSYEEMAYDWLQSAPGSGRVLIIPPTTNVLYPYYTSAVAQNSYAIPSDYWGAAPPRPLVTVGQLGDWDTLLPKAIYTGDAGLLGSILAATGVQYVVLRSDAVNVWGITYYAPINASFVTAHFPFLTAARIFGPIEILVDTDFQSLTSAYAYPDIVYGDMSTLSTIQTLVDPGEPVVLTANQSGAMIDQLISQFDAPTINACNPSCNYGSGGPSIAPTFTIPPASQELSFSSSVDQPYLYWVQPSNATFGAFSVLSVTRSFNNTFDSANETEARWHLWGSPYTLGPRGVSTNTSGELYGITNQSTLSASFEVLANVSVATGFGAGLLLSPNSTDFSVDSITVQLVPAWQSVVIYTALNGNLTQTAIPARLAFNTTYSLTATGIGGYLTIELDGAPLYTYAPGFGLVYAGINAIRSASNFSYYAESEVNATPLTSHLFQGSESSTNVFDVSGLNVSLVSSVPTSQQLVMMGGVEENPYDVLNPPTLNVSFTPNSSPGSWTIQRLAVSPAFLFIRYAYLEGWQSTSGDCVQVVSVEVGCSVTAGASVFFDNHYSAVGLTTGVVVVGATTMTLGYWILIAARRTRRR